MNDFKNSLAIRRTRRRARSTDSATPVKRRFLPMHFAEAATLTKPGRYGDLRCSDQFVPYMAPCLLTTVFMPLFAGLLRFPDNGHPGAVAAFTGDILFGVTAFSLFCLLHGAFLQARAEIRAHKCKKLYGFYEADKFSRNLNALLASDLDFTAKAMLSKTCEEYWAMLRQEKAISKSLTRLQTLEQETGSSANQKLIEELRAQKDNLIINLSKTRETLESAYRKQETLIGQAESARLQKRVQRKIARAQKQAKSVRHSEPLTSPTTDVLKAHLAAADEVKNLLGEKV